MALNPLLVGDNPQQPSIVAEAYIPDQLVIGNRNLVTDSGPIFGAAALPRGTVLGQTKFGSVTASVGKSFASGSITIAALPANGDTLTIGNGSTSTVITFLTQPNNSNELPPPGQQWIAASVGAQAAALCEYLNSSTDANISLMSYAIDAVTASKIDVTADIVGTGGNAFTLATSDTGAFTPSGATLSGGTANTGTSTVGSMSAGAFLQPGNYTVTLTATGSTAAFTVVDPHGEELATGNVGTAFRSAQLNFTITAGGTPTTGDQFVLTGNPTNTGVYKASVATATDGSENPCAILADYSDPTVGGAYPSGTNVTGGFYLAGEFNGNALIVDPSWTVAGLKAALRPLGITIKYPLGAADPS